ncbi:Retrovirus-related Pol polyprotein from transposon 17.6 [Nosema granulosis]|uniref:Retrovirus-related Pol polyprotein from transposon 17.6 n=1 Tax=Nosema granulosis TaxID=83296 RepID=A0A9P6KXZ8_9MICR|nr:Retrovirus-related Pol polyprotein from transposon 17.6 [Nosema granulosis]
MIGKIKNEIATKMRLKFPDYNKKFILECDASDIGIGSVLRQEDRIIGYFSKKLQGAELNYSIVEKEYLAILLSLIHFQKIIQGSYTEAYTDSRNCIYESKKTTSRINRWKLLMNEFNYKKVHIKGEDNVIADHLSRCFHIQTNKLEEDYRDAINENSEKKRGRLL